VTPKGIVAELAPKLYRRCHSCDRYATYAEATIFLTTFYCDKHAEGRKVYAVKDSPIICEINTTLGLF
jgi:hypothetical protein